MELFRLICGTDGSAPAMKGDSGGGGSGKGGSSGAKNSDAPSNSPAARNTTSPAGEHAYAPTASAENSNPSNNHAADDDDGSTNPSITSGDMAEMSGFVPTSAAAAAATTAGGTNTAEHTGSIPGAYAVPGINSTMTSSSAPTASGAEGDFSATTGTEQLRRLSSRTRLQVLSTLLSGSSAAGGNGSNSALISSLVSGTHVVVAEATLIPDADAVRASQASPDIPIGGDVLNDGSDDDDGGEDDDEEVGYNDEENGRSGHGSGSDGAPQNNRRSYISGITSTGDEETHATGAGSVPTMVTAVTAESMQGKHVLSRRGIFLLAAGMLVLLGIALGIAIPLSRRNVGGGGSTTPEEEVDLSEVLTYAPEAICYSHIPLMTDLSRVCTDPSTLPKGGPFCQLVTDGVLAQLHRIHREQQTIAADGGGTSNELPPMPKVDMLITNAGAQRGDILPASNVTLGTIRQNLPFLSNRVTLLEVSPFDVHRTLEGGLNYTLQTIPIKVSFSAGYPYASNLRFDIDLTQPYGQRVSNMELWRETGDMEATTVNPDNDVGDGGSWVLLDPTDTTTKYVAATNSYLGGGGDQYFPNIPEEAKTVYSDLGFTNTFAEYCRSVDILLGPDLDEMSTQNFVPLDEY